MIYKEAIELLKNTNPLRITVSGDIGSGKSTFAKRLAQELDIPRTYIGELMREAAEKRNMTLDEFNELLEKDMIVDREMDEMQRTKSKEISRGIFEGRMAWHFVETPDVRVFLNVKPSAAAQRIWNDKNDQRDKYQSVEELTKANVSRKQSEEKRYQTYYGLSAYDLQNFDVVMDTTDLSIDEVFQNTVIQIATYIARRT